MIALPMVVVFLRSRARAEYWLKKQRVWSARGPLACGGQTRSIHWSHSCWSESTRAALSGESWSCRDLREEEIPASSATRFLSVQTACSRGDCASLQSELCAAASEENASVRRSA